MNRTWKPTAAGILNIATGAVTVVYVIAASIGWETRLPLLFLIFALPPLASGILAIQRKCWALTIAGSALSLPAGAISIILLMLSRDGF